MGIYGGLLLFAAVTAEVIVGLLSIAAVLVVGKFYILNKITLLAWCG